jgi:drug/metabolite transporter (DMT)-like permease
VDVVNSSSQIQGITLKRIKFSPYLQALISAVLFGMSTPLSKLLLGEMEPISLAALLYLGSGIGLLAFYFAQRLLVRAKSSEARLNKRDLPWLTGAILFGGVAAPIILLFSLRNTPAATASLLLNFECVATTLIAILAFKEAAGKRIITAIALITLAAILLSLDLNAAWGVSLGALGILLACLFWGMDNNFTRMISAKDPVIITMVKGLAAGCVSLVLAFLVGQGFPDIKTVLLAILLGSLSYGGSIVLFIQAMRGLGAARTSALFNTAPFVGMLMSFAIFSNMPGWTFYTGLPLMLFGTFLIIYEKHHHTHLHPAVTHEHAHNHNDGHHSHPHESPVEGSHSHLHTHEEVTHDHEHRPDIHHQHEHENWG